MSGRRWTLILCCVPFYTLVMMVVSTYVCCAIVSEGYVFDLPQFTRDLEHEFFRQSGWWAFIGTFWAVNTLIQIVFLLPVIQNRPPMGTRGKSLTMSLILSGLIAGLLFAALVWIVIELGFVLVGSTMVDSDHEWVAVVPMGGAVVGWLGWSFVLVVFTRGIWADRVLGRIVGVLIGGSILELVITMPLDIMVRRRSDCYCLEGSLFALIISAFGLMWLAGPGVVIAVMSKRHRLWRETHCENCGYAKGPSPGERCPECGCMWNAKETHIRHHASTSERESKGG